MRPARSTVTLNGSIPLRVAKRAHQADGRALRNQDRIADLHGFEVFRYVGGIIDGDPDHLQADAMHVSREAASNKGSSSRQGAHQLAQKLHKSGRPCHSDSLRLRPERSGKLAASSFAAPAPRLQCEHARNAAGSRRRDCHGAKDRGYGAPVPSRRSAPTSAMPARSITRPAWELLSAMRSSRGSKIDSRSGTPCHASTRTLTACARSPA